MTITDGEARRLQAALASAERTIVSLRQQNAALEGERPSVARAERKRCADLIRAHADDCAKLPGAGDLEMRAHLDGMRVAAAFLDDGMQG